MDRKGKMGAYPFALGVLAIIGLLFVATMYAPQPAPIVVQSSVAGAQAAAGGNCLLSATPTVTFATPDKYNKGTATTTQNMYRVVSVGSDGQKAYGTWVDVAGAATFQLAGGAEIEYVAGIDSNDEGAEPYGRHVASYFVPCKETATIVEYVSNDALSTDLGDVYFDEYGTANTNQTMGAGDVKNLAIQFTGSFEEDFGNKDCGEQTNVLVMRINASQFDAENMEVTSITDITTQKTYAVTPTSVPAVYNNANAAAGDTNKAYFFPVVETNHAYKVTYIADADDTVNPNYVTDGGGDPLVFYLYDSEYYFDGNLNEIKCGVEDETQSEIGAASADSIIQYVN